MLFFLLAHFRQAPFSATAANLALANAKEYGCGGSLWWLDPFWSAAPIYVSQKSLQVLRADVFAEPGPWPSHLPLTVAVNASWKADKVQANFGRLEQLSPEEIFAAFIGRVAQAIRDGEDEMTLMAWREMSLSAHIVFKVIDSLQDKLAESISIREKYITTYESLARSVLGRIMEIVHYRRSRDPGHGMTTSELSKLWKAEVRQSTSKLSEDVTADFIAKAINVWETVLQHEACRALSARWWAL